MLTPERIHFIGIGGVGMSALARFALKAGARASGSDLRENRFTKELSRLGAAIVIGQNGPVPPCDRAVISSAIPDGNRELVSLRRRGVEVVHRSRLLAEYINHFHGLAVAGTHGKTTTSSLLYHVLQQAGRMPSALLGGELVREGTNCVVGSSELLVAEADESDGSFIHLQPGGAIVTSIDPDVNVTAEAYRECGYSRSRTLRRVEELFQAFVSNTRGPVIACIDHPGVARNIDRWAGPILTYGLREGATLRANVVRHHNYQVEADLLYKGRPAGSIKVPLSGEHNLLNALGVVLLAGECGVPLEEAVRHIGSFSGVRRRFEVVGRAEGRVYVDDYAHNPQKIAAALKGARDGEPRRVVAVFQPHRYTRTKLLQKDYPKSFADADLVLVTDIYSAGEEPVSGVDPRALAAEIGRHVPTVYTPGFEEVADLLDRVGRPGDLIIGLGAGSVGEWMRALAERSPEAVLSAA